MEVEVDTNRYCTEVDRIFGTFGREKVKTQLEQKKGPEYYRLAAFGQDRVQEGSTGFPVGYQPP